LNLIRKNSHDRILREESNKQHLHIVPKSYPKKKVCNMLWSLINMPL